MELGIGVTSISDGTVAGMVAWLEPATVTSVVTLWSMEGSVKSRVTWVTSSRDLGVVVLSVHAVWIAARSSASVLSSLI